MDTEINSLQSINRHYETSPLNCTANQSQKHNTFIDSVKKIVNETTVLRSNYEQTSNEESHFQRREGMNINFLQKNKQEIQRLKIKKEFMHKRIKSISNSEDIVFKEYLIKYNANLKNSEYTPETKRQRLRSLAMLKQDFGSVKLNEISKNDIDNYLEKNDPTEARLLKPAITHLFAQAEKDDKIRNNPIKFSKKSRTRLTIEALITVFKSDAIGVNPDQVCKEINISNRTYYNWRKNYDSLNIDDLYKIQEEMNKNTSKVKLSVNNVYDTLKKYMEKKALLLNSTNQAEILPGYSANLTFAPTAIPKDLLDSSVFLNNAMQFRQAFYSAVFITNLQWLMPKR